MSSCFAALSVIIAFAANYYKPQQFYQKHLHVCLWAHLFKYKCEIMSNLEEIKPRDVGKEYTKLVKTKNI